ncbi:uncharacterized protein ARB_06805 [Trichophyton benhamiae CBS 112371]|uniref:Uncharacterized protein n=1 Tax=Arthroderma benhamiae (strain ATCC MYA-4681 / CBS 112371) TaxID=663331 RepID=D4AQX6_ARTBC|nr:uncharacterized protein ARB_06805 [Trichophyton benhamiae CBS 112371]EFE34405.1 hypothetical protein ARB_06805 [Trichophyton benhamiae CBS 112371]
MQAIRSGGTGWLDGAGQVRLKKTYVLSRATARENPACWAAIPDAALSNSRREKESIEGKSSRKEVKKK